MGLDALAAVPCAPRSLRGSKQAGVSYTTHAPQKESHGCAGSGCGRSLTCCSQRCGPPAPGVWGVRYDGWRGPPPPHEPPALRMPQQCLRLNVKGIKRAGGGRGQGRTPCQALRNGVQIKREREGELHRFRGVSGCMHQLPLVWVMVRGCPALPHDSEHRRPRPPPPQQLRLRSQHGSALGARHAGWAADGNQCARPRHQSRRGARTRGAHRPRPTAPHTLRCMLHARPPVTRALGAFNRRRWRSQ
jgi:hypothetical protein